MNITWKGQSCFQISAVNQSKNPVNIVIDPFSEEIGLKLPKMEADVVLVSHQHKDHNNVKAIEGAPFVINEPGEYERKEIYIQGIPSEHDISGKEKTLNTIFTVEVEDLRICHLGDLGQKELTPDQVEKIGNVDILMIPVGGVYTIEAKEALQIMAQLEPNITIPMHYALPKLQPKLDGVDNFLKAAGVKSVVPIPKFSIKKKEITADEAKIIVLMP